MPNQEERLVAELEILDIRYLSRQSNLRARTVRSPERLLVDLIQQPNSRVRTAFIAVLMAQPELSHAAPAALDQLKPEEQLTFKLLYTAAVILQRKYAERLRGFLPDRWLWLPDWFSSELGLPTNQPPDRRLNALGMIHRQKTGIVLNWSGTYENVAHHLIRRWELEQQWNQ